MDKTPLFHILCGSIESLFIENNAASKKLTNESDSKISMKNGFYSKLIKDPLIVASISALIGVAFTLFSTHVYNSILKSRDRDAGLRILLTNLQSHKNQLDVLNDNLGKNRIYGELDSYPIVSFLNGSIVALSKDETLIINLNQHLQNIELIKHVISRIDLTSAGFTSVHQQIRIELENSLKSSLIGVMNELDLCVVELKKVINK